MLIMNSFHGTGVNEKDIDMVKKDNSYELYTNPDFDFDSWYKKNWPDARMPEILESIRLIRQQHKWIAAVGYCWVRVFNISPFQDESPRFRGPLFRHIGIAC